MNRPFHPVTLAEAAQQSPTLTQLMQKAVESADCLRAVEALIPLPLRAAVRAGPLEGGTWCLLIQGNSAATKLRQLVPTIQRALIEQGREITAIRLKVQLSLHGGASQS